MPAMRSLSESTTLESITTENIDVVRDDTDVAGERSIERQNVTLHRLVVLSIILNLRKLYISALETGCRDVSLRYQVLESAERVR